MAFFDKRELVDVIRHEIRIEDETGTAAVLVRPASKRAKYGGLPLNFRVSHSEDDDDEEMDNYTIPLYEETNSTRELIASRLRSRTVSSDQFNRKEAGGDPLPSSGHDLFVPRPIASVDLAPKPSIFSQYLTENMTALQNPLNEYAVFEATGTGPSRKITILYVIDGEEICRHEISVIATARVFQVIAFCLYKYFHNTSQELPGSADEYELFMADETGEVDSDFPPLERTRVIADLGFPVLALVRTRDETDVRSERRVTVYFPSGLNFVILIPSEDLPFSWLVEEALRRKEENEEILDSGIIRIREYSLEQADQFDAPLDLSKPVGTCTNCDEFVMIRKNSSRGNFHPRPRSLFSQRSMIMSPKSPGISSPRRQSRNIFDFPMEPSTPLTLPSSDKEEIIACYKVERLHKYKPRWTANLLFQGDELEISPFASDSERRKSFLPQQYQKSIRVPWDFVCDVSMQEKERGRESVHVLSITWLPTAAEQQANGLTLQEMMEGSSLTWKTVQVECRSREDAIEIHRYIATVIQTRQSPTQQAWMFSSENQKRPSASAESALAALQSTDTVSTQTTEAVPKARRKSRFRQVARLSRILLQSERRLSTASTTLSRHDSM